jgi:hypothetical protein
MSKRTWKQRLALTVPIIAATAVPFIVAPSANAMPTSPAQTGCSGQWDITQIDIRQDNGWTVKLKQTQQGSRIWGDAGSGNGSEYQYGLVWDGNVTGNDVNFTVGWRNGAIGDYHGTVRADGYTTGTATDRNSGATTNWSLARLADCL